MQCSAAAKILIVTALLLVPIRASRAADVLQNIPPDALGFVLARNIGAVDGKVQRLLTNLHLPFGGPLAFLQTVTGIGDGLNAQGDLLLAVLPDDSGAEQPKFCVWLPVADYDRFVASLGSTPGTGITLITIADVDLLATKQGEWALVMDPDDRGRMERMLAAGPAPPKQISAWKSWIGTNDSTVVVLAGGLHDLLSWAAAPAAGYGASADSVGNVDDDLFGGPVDETDITPQNAPRPERAANDISARVRELVRKVLTSSPKALQWAHAAETIGLGIRLDEEGNAFAGLRAKWSKDGNFAPDSHGGDGSLPPSISDGNQYVLQGGGNLPQPLAAVLAGAYVRLVVDDLKTEMGLSLDSEVVARFQDAVEQAAAEVPAAGVVSLAGAKEDGVYTNNFLVVRVGSAKIFVDHANEVMRLWNQMNREADEGTRLVFDVEEVPTAGRTATHYTIDIAAADGIAVIPEVRQAMEKLFGPGGKLRLIVAPADDHNVLLAMATPEQAQRVLKTLQEQRADWEGEREKRTGVLLQSKGDWQLFVSPHGYNTWLSRQMDAMTGPVFGGPIVKPFPDSPPIGVTGGARDYELWIDAAAPAETVQSAGTYLRSTRARNPR